VPITGVTRLKLRGIVLDSFEWNKVAAALIVGALLYKVVEISAESVVHAEAPAETAYAVAVADEGTAETTMTAEVVVADAGPTLEELLATGSAEKGARVFRRCAACHSADNGGAHKVGPNLWNVVGGPHAHAADYGYSDAMASVGGNWDYAALDAFLANPAGAIPGNKMPFAGLRKPAERADVILYLRAQSDNPVPLPAVEAESEGEM